MTDNAIAKQLLNKLANMFGYECFMICYNICTFNSPSLNYNADITYIDADNHYNIIADSYSKAFQSIVDVIRLNAEIEVFTPPNYNGQFHNDGKFLHADKNDLTVWLFDCVLAGYEGADIL